jgi:hypothetical protein
MNKLRNLTALLAAASAAFAFGPRASAQVETWNTIVDYVGEGITGFTNGTTALTQSITDVAELDSVTFALTTTSGTNATVTQNINAYVVQWNTTTDSPMSTFTAPTSVGGSDSTIAANMSPISSFTVPPVGTGAWTTGTTGQGSFNEFNLTLNLDQLLDPTLTYGIVLIDTTAASGLGLMDVNAGAPYDNPYISGGAFSYSGSNLGTAYYGVASSGTLSSLGAYDSGQETGQPFGSYGFSQIVLVPGGNAIPVPEPREAALAICALFVACLVGHQLYLRRREQPVAAVAA